MDDTFVTTVYVILAEMERALQLPVKYKPKMTPAEILTVAVVAAKHFHNNWLNATPQRGVGAFWRARLFEIECGRPPPGRGRNSWASACDRTNSRRWRRKGRSGSLGR